MRAQDERLTRRVGVVALVALAAAIAYVVFVHDRIEWGRRIRVEVYFRDTGGLLEGAPFVAGGRDVGVVDSIALAPHDPAGPLAGDPGVVVGVLVEAGAAAVIDRGGDVFVAARGVLAARYLEIGPAREPGRVLADGDRLVGRDPPTLDRVIRRTWNNLVIAREFAEQVRPEFDALRRELGALATTLDELAPAAPGAASLGLELAGLIDEARTLRDRALGGEPGLARLSATLDLARATIGQARRTLDELRPRVAAFAAGARALGGRLAGRGPVALRQLELALDRARAAIAKLDPLLAQVAALRALVASGEGSLGRLMRDPEFPEDAKELGRIIKRQPWKLIDRPQDN